MAARPLPVLPDRGGGTWREEEKRAGVFGGVKYDARERGGERKRDVRGDSVACCVYYVTF